MSTLSPVLSPGDLSWVELQAARLDGDVYELSDGYCQIGELEGPLHRALAVLGARSPRLIAELETAAWVWGAGSEPSRPMLAVTPGARTRLAFDRRPRVREVVYAEGDLVELGPVRVTSPLRTALDFARRPDFDADDAAIVARLAADARFGAAECRAVLANRAKLPGKKIAAERLTRLLSEGTAAQAVDTR